MTSARRWLLVMSVLLSIVVLGCSSEKASSPPAAGDPSQPAAAAAGAGPVVSSKGGLDVKVTFANAAAAQPNGNLVFQIVLDTHSIDLNAVDLARGTTLTPEPGTAVTAGFRWQAEGSGHHIAGELSLPNKDAQGKPLVTAETRSLILEMKDLAGTGAHTVKFQNSGWKVSP